MQAQTIKQLNAEIEQVNKYQCLLAMSAYKQLCDAQDSEMIRMGATESDLASLDESDSAVVQYFQRKQGYFISFGNSFRGWIAKSINRDFDVADVRDATHAFERLATDEAKSEFGKVVSKLRDTLSELGQMSTEQSKEVSTIMWALQES